MVPPAPPGGRDDGNPDANTQPPLRPAPPLTGRRLALAAVAAANLLWAGTYVAGKAALDQVPFPTLNALRFSLAALVLAPVVWRHRAGLPRDRDGRLRLLAVAGFGFCANKALEFGGLGLTTATDTALLITSESLMTALLAVLLLRDRLRPRTVVAIAIGAAGVYVLVEGGLVAPHLPTGNQGLGDLLVVASLGMESVATIAGAVLMRSRDPLLVTGAAVMLSLIVWLPVETGLVLQRGLPELTPSAWAGVAYLALVGTVVGYGLWFWGMRRMSAQELTPFLLIQPVAGTLLATAIRGERPTAAVLTGGLLVLIAVSVGASGPAPTPVAEDLRRAPETL